jgi:hypothetical protein
MVRALPAAQRALNHSRAKEAAYKDAVAIYTESHRTFEASSDRNRKAPISLRDLAARYRGLISVTTLSRRIKRLPSALEVGQLRTRLKTEEEDMLVKHLKEQAAVGFPYTHRAIMEVGNDILRARCGREHSNFRPLGKRWSARFVLRRSQEIKTYWSTSLHSSRAQCVNATVLEAWNSLQERAQRGDFTDGSPILPENIANMDETGWVPAVRQTHRVIGPTGQKLQFEIESGMRENITIIGTILADGTSTRPIVIFKGANVQRRWGVGDLSHNIAKAQ